MSRPLRQIVEGLISRDLSPEAQQRAFAGFAREKLAEAVEVNRQATGRAVPYEQVVDGVKGAPLESVKPDGGRILFLFDVDANEMLTWISDQLVRHAPRLTGRFADSFKLFAGGRELAPGAPLPEGDVEIVFLNVQPYARRIERGWSDQAPDGVFQGVAALARAHFGNRAFIRFSFRAVSEFGLIPYVPMGGRARNRGARGRFTATPADPARRAAAAAEREARTPAIVIRLRT